MHDFKHEIPDEYEDVFTEDHIRFFQSGKEVLRLVPDATEEEMWDGLNKWMEKSNFWPSVWFVSDHGNISLMTDPRWADSKKKKKRPKKNPERP